VCDLCDRVCYNIFQIFSIKKLTSFSLNGMQILGIQKYGFKLIKLKIVKIIEYLNRRIIPTSL